MSLTFFDYEIPVLKVLVKLGGSASVKDVYPLVAKLMQDRWTEHPEQLGTYKSGQIIWKNKTRWAREYLKRKNQLDGSEKGKWTITDAGKERLRLYEKTGRDPDEGRATIEGIDPSVAETDEAPEKIFNKLEQIQDHGDILGVRGIVYEPINEQGVVLLFAAVCHDLGFRIEGVRTKFPDALLIRKNDKGTFSKCLAEFEFRASNYQLHKHPLKGCDLIICWENDWQDCPIEILELKKIVRKFVNENN